MAKVTAQNIYESMKKDIIHNEYKAHQRISEDALALRFGTSRTPVREALRMLEHDGFVICVKNVGTFIRQISAAEIGDFFDVRGVLEGLCAKLCVKNADAEFTGDLRITAKNVVDAHLSHDLESANELDTLFHGKINDRSGNEFAKKCLSSMSDRLMWFLNISNISRIDYLGSIPFENMVNSHMTIISAIENGDELKAEAAAKAHVDEAKRFFIDFCYNKFML